MNTLKELRDRIDTTDKKIVELINERALIVQSVGELKKETKTPIYVPKRELEIFEILGNFSKLIDKKSIRNIFTEIISACRALEKKISILSFGLESEIVALKVFGNNINFVAKENFELFYEELENYKKFLDNSNELLNSSSQSHNNNFDLILIESSFLERLSKNYLFKNIAVCQQIILEIEYTNQKRETKHYSVISIEPLQDSSEKQIIVL